MGTSGGSGGHGPSTGVHAGGAFRLASPLEWSGDGP